MPSFNKDFPEFADHLNTEFQTDCEQQHSDVPWFGHFILQAPNGEELAYKVGTQNIPAQRIVNRFHPLANAYYTASPGDDFHLSDYQRHEHNGANRYHNISGDIALRTTVTADDREIQRVNIQGEEEAWHLEKTHNGYAFQAAHTEQRQHVDGLPDISALLTPEQYELITKQTQAPLIIQGQAGSGKTTVALFRVAWLMQEWQEEQRVNPNKVLIVMFNKPLEGFIQTTLNALELDDCNVSTFHSWVLAEIRNAYAGNFAIYTSATKKKFSADAVKPMDDYASLASDIKNHAGMLSAIDAFILRQTGKLEGWLESKLAPYDADDLIEEVQHSQEPIVKLLKTMRTRLVTQKAMAEGHEQQRLEQIHRVFDKAISRMTQYKEELLRLLKDSALLSKYIPDFSDEQFEQLATYQSALQGLKAKSNKPGPYISFDDTALMLRLIQLKHGGFPDKDSDAVHLFDHLVIDEAQDFGAIQLKVLLSSVKSHTGITIVGDMNQKIMPQVEFPGWDALADQLNIRNADVAKLEVAHRSTPSIMNLANAIIDEPTLPDATGTPPQLIELDDETQYIEAVIDHLHALVTEHPDDHICLLCRTPYEASILNSRLKKRCVEQLGEEAGQSLLDSLRLSHNNNFEFTRGITITNMQQIKGLEFEVVVMVNPAEDFYSNDEQGKRFLYTAITRAKKELRLITHEAPTPLLQPALDKGWLTLEGQSTVVEVEFTDEDDEPF